MGSMVMDPSDIAAIPNFTSICTYANRIHSTGVFAGENPLKFSVPLLFVQLGLCSGTIILLSRLLKPLGQPLIVSQILGGLVLGSSGLCHLEAFRETIFPPRGLISLDAVSGIGHIFYFFLIGVQTDFSIMKNIDKRAFGFGFCSVILPRVFVSIYLGTLYDTNIIDRKISECLSTIGKVESFIHFPMVASLLSELHLINSEIGRLALSTSMASNILSFMFLFIGTIWSREGNTKSIAPSTIYSSVVVIVVIIVAIRPIILWMVKKNPVGQPLKEEFVIALLLGALVVAFCSQAFGLHIYFGPLLLGITIPPGPPIGSSLVERLELITSWVFMPVFFVKIGLIVNIYTIKLMNFVFVSFAIIFSALGKFLGAIIITYYCNLPMRHGVLLGLILNTQGAVELGMFKLLRKSKIIENEEFVIMCIFVMVLVAIITPIIGYLFDPSRRYVVHKQRSVMHSRLEIDLRVLVCIHDQEDVPSAINLLEALNPTRRSHLVVYVLHLVELLGRANPQLIHHKHMKVRTSRSYPSEHIVNAFRYFGQSNCEVAAIHAFTAVSPSATMYVDVCSLALDKMSSLILVPFHKRFHSNGTTLLSKSKMKIMNNHILDKAPCSVALVVERGISKVSTFIAANLHSFQIGVVFIGGADDRETICIGARMAGHPNVNLTVVRLLENENVSSVDVKERILDDKAMAEFQEIMSDNYRVRYIEEVAKDCTGTVAILRSMGNNFDLIIVGRRHNSCSALVQGLVLWNEQTELGAIGEVLASSDFMGNAIILVVQQHTNEVNEDLGNDLECNIPTNKYLAQADAK